MLEAKNDRLETGLDALMKGKQINARLDEGSVLNTGIKVTEVTLP